MLRSIVFWTHLACGIVCGLVVLTMSFTGVVLTYERQIKAWAAEQHYVQPVSGQQRLPLEHLIERQRALEPAFAPATLVLTNAEGAPVTFRAGRRNGASLNPYTGEPMATGWPRLDAFFSWNTGFHRWFNLQGENRALARQVTGVSNVAFLFLIFSGLYLWLPRFWRWSQFKVRLLLSQRYTNSKARDFHWHHIFGLWSALPLLVVVYTGAVISYPWAANLMYRAFGAEQPVQAATRAPRGADAAVAGEAVPMAQALDLSTLVDKALAHEDSASWRRLTLGLPAPEDRTVQIEIDRGNGAQAQLRHTLELDRRSGQVLGRRDFDDQPLAQRLRGIARFLHTGEVLGVWGQTIAGLVSLASLFLVWTGLALSYRRLIMPLLRRQTGAASPAH